MRRKFLKNVKQYAFLLGSLACIAFAFALTRSPAFEMGESYTLYLGANSSSLQISTKTPALEKLFRTDIAGESTQYAGELYEEIKDRYRAQLLFTEEACGVTNYYLYSPRLGDCVYLNGCAVNLHVAVSGGRTAVGTPLIFGGF